MRLAPKRRAVIVTNNDSAYETAFDLAEADVAVTIAELRSQPSGDLLARAAQLGIAIFPNSSIADVLGDKQLKAVKLGGRHAVTIECDVLGMSGGWNPAVHLTSHGGIKPTYDEASRPSCRADLPMASSAQAQCLATSACMPAFAMAWQRQSRH